MVQYYKSGGVDPEHAISYLNTLRQRKQNKDIVATRGTARNSKQQQEGRKPGSQNEIALKNPEEYARFLELHKKLGIARMTQYGWMIQVVYIASEIRKSPEFKSLSSTDKQRVESTGTRYRM